MENPRAKTAQELKDDEEANYFAICLLMPEDMVREEWKKRWHVGVSVDDTTTAMARAFQVSYTMMANRLVQLKIIKVAI